MNTDEAFELVRAERGRQPIIHPWRTPADDIGDGLRLAILTEELGEVARELHPEGDRERLKTELVQVAAIAVAWLEGLESTTLILTTCSVCGKPTTIEFAFCASCSQDRP